MGIWGWVGRGWWGSRGGWVGVVGYRVIGSRGEEGPRGSRGSG